RQIALTFRNMCFGLTLVVRDYNRPSLQRSSGLLHFSNQSTLLRRNNAGWVTLGNAQHTAFMLSQCGCDAFPVTVSLLLQFVDYCLSLLTGQRWRCRWGGPLLRASRRRSLRSSFGFLSGGAPLWLRACATASSAARESVNVCTSQRVCRIGIEVCPTFKPRGI